jgi:hypothetical protein
VIRSVIVVGVPNTERRRDLTGLTRVAAESAVPGTPRRRVPTPYKD